MLNFLFERTSWRDTVPNICNLKQFKIIDFKKLFRLYENVLIKFKKLKFFKKLMRFRVQRPNTDDVCAI